MSFFQRALDNIGWLPVSIWHRVTRHASQGRVHLILTVADHFEPSFIHHVRGYAPPAEQQARLARWCGEFPRTVRPWKDADGRTWRHTYFYPAEQYQPAQVTQLSELCRMGGGEIEVHLHHGVEAPDTPEHLRSSLQEFVNALVGHGCLSRWDGVGEPRYAFVHGNWSLANSWGGRCCGVDEELQILAETGCYADFTLPSAPHPSQVNKINSLYEVALPLDQAVPHRRGCDLHVGRPPQKFPLIFQGPLLLARRRGSLRPSIENGVLSGSNPPTLARFRRWCELPITVQGRPDWVFLKLHCHGMDPMDTGIFLGDVLGNFLRDLTAQAPREGIALHFVSAREMVNVALAACDGKTGDPAQFFDYHFRLNH